MILNPTSIELARIQGFNSQLQYRGRQMTTDTGETVTVLVQNAMPLPDDSKIAQARNIVYSIITCLSGSLKDPRTVGSFTEGVGAAAKNHTVICYDETSGDRVTWKFEVESQRDDFTAQNQGDATIG